MSILLDSKELTDLLVEEESKDRILYPNLDLNIIINNFLREASPQKLRNSMIKPPEDRDIYSLKAELDELERKSEENNRKIHMYEAKIEQLRAKLNDQRTRNRLLPSSRQSQPASLYWKAKYEEMNQKYQKLCNVTNGTHF